MADINNNLNYFYSYYYYYASHPECNHEWLWQTAPGLGACFTPVEYVTAVRLRLGAAGPDEPAICGRCGGALLDASAAHALCCANGVVGHNAVRDELHAAARPCDPSAEIEPLGLIPSHPTLRPADVLTSAALPGRLAALDVGVASPHAASAGDDCTEMRITGTNSMPKASRMCLLYGVHTGVRTPTRCGSW